MLQVQERVEKTRFRIDDKDNRFNTLFKHSLDGILVADTLTRRFELANPAICRMLGYSEEELRKLKIEDIHPLKERLRILDLFSKLVRGERTLVPEIPVSRKDGSVFLASISALPLIIDGRAFQMGIFRDMTPNIVTDEALKESEQRFSIVFEKSPISISITRLADNRFLDVNDAFLAMTGLTREEVIGHTSLELNVWKNPGDRDRIIEHIRNQGTISGMEVELRQKTGRITDILYSSELVELSGQPCMLSMSLDISERKKTLQELRHRLDLQDKLSKINATVPGMIYSFRMNPDGSTSLPYSNAKLFELFGLKPEDVAEDFSPALARIHPADISHVWESITESARTLKTWRNEFRVRHPQKGEVWIDGYSLPERQADGSILWHGFAYDITDYKRSQERLRKIISASPAVLYVLEAGGNRLAINWISENLYPVVGWTPAEALERENWWLNNIHPDDLRHVLDLHPIPYETDHQVLEYRLRQKDGGYIWVRDEKQLLRGTGGKPDEIVGAWVDISKQKQLESQLRQAQKMEAIGQLSSGVAHDFNNLLTMILGYSSMLLAEMSPDAPHRSHVEDIKKAGDRAAVLTRQLLAFSRRENLKPKITDLRKVVQGIENMLRRLIGESVTLLKSYAREVPCVMVDPNQMEQVILNLAANARDAMPRGGRLTVEIGPMELDTDYCRQHPGSKPGSYSMLSVADTGSGIAPEIMGLIFEPFFTTKKQGKGTGLGLATVFGIVKSSGGYIEVQSNVGAGTRFRIFLPALGQIAETEAKNEDAVTAPMGDETILVVEDEAGVRRSVAQTLVNHGYSVLEATDGLMAQTVARESGVTISLMLSDILMPQINGVQLAEILAARNPGMKVLFMSGYSENSMIRENTAFRDAVCMSKPFSSLDLLKKVREALDGGTPHSA